MAIVLKAVKKVADSISSRPCRVRVRQPYGYQVTTASPSPKILSPDICLKKQREHAHVPRRVKKFVVGTHPLSHRTEHKAIDAAGIGNVVPGSEIGQFAAHDRLLRMVAMEIGSQIRDLVFHEIERRFAHTAPEVNSYASNQEYFKTRDRRARGIYERAASPRPPRPVFAKSYSISRGSSGDARHANTGEGMSIRLAAGYGTFNFRWASLSRRSARG